MVCSMSPKTVAEIDRMKDVQLKRKRKISTGNYLNEADKDEQDSVVYL